jgi:perosamine synthetase
MEIKNLSIHEGATLKQALEKIDINGLGVVFIVDSEDHLLGLLSDGDIRRTLLQGFTLNASVDTIMNKKPVSLPVESEDVTILSHLTETIKVIPLVDKKSKLVDYASIHKIRRISVASPLLTGNELAYVTDCIKTNWISSQGKYVRQFEALFSEYHKGRQAIAVSNGTVALHLALVALNIKEGDEVIVPDLTFAASVNAVIYTGATPVLADIDPETWNIDVEQIRKLITPRTKAIMPVHLYGQPCEMGKIMQIAKEHNLLVIEDCAEALGSYYNDIPIGCFGDAATFSFYGNKTISTGEGGMVLFKDTAMAERAAVLRDHGMLKSKRYWHQEVGFNYRLTNIQAAIGVAQFERLSDFVEAKKQISKKYNSAFADIPYLQLPIEQINCSNSYWLYTMLVRSNAPFSRDKLIEHLHAKGIETRPVFFSLHEMPPYEKYGACEELNVSKLVSGCGISLPSSVNLTTTELDYVCKSVKNFIKKVEVVLS